jgi:soluble lytic murein transglycosylase-like protein
LNQPIAAEIPFDRDTLSEADVEAVQESGRGLRALALLQVGQPARAAAELRQLFTETRDQPGFGRSILLVARAAGLHALASELGAVMQPAAARLPPTRLQPAGGFKVDPALLYALTRMESNFDPTAESPAGARGLMQLMPGTAEFVMAGTGRTVALHNPATNLDIGQRYLLQLASLDTVGADLIKLLASYNAGPGNLARWLDGMQRETDPLLFMESLPGAETRAYVPRALAYTWLYAAQLGLPSPSLDELAVGLWPRLQTRPSRREPVVRLH